jgi:phospholipase/lecithinase/hemolysin
MNGELTFMFAATSDNTLVQGYTGPNATIASPSATDQVAQFLASHNGKANVADALYVILIGANDAFFDPNVTGAQTVENVSSIMKKLGKKGERLASRI